MSLSYPDPLGLGLNVAPVRKCGPCQLCCKLLPIAEMGKPANHRCTHQRLGKGCAVYGKPERPESCVSWACQWLLGLDTEALRRPDLSRYVIDMVPDFVEVVDEAGNRTPIEVVQVWCDPKQREAWEADPALARFLERRAAEGKGALIRYSSTDAVTVFPPPISARFGAEADQWIVHEHGTTRPERTGRDRFEGVLRARAGL